MVPRATPAACNAPLQPHRLCTCTRAPPAAHTPAPLLLATSPPAPPPSLPAQRAGLQLFEGAEAASSHLASVLNVDGGGRTLGLRDYYPGWNATGCTAAGGKPLLLERENPRLLQIFFDDHVLPWDAHIVDVRHRGAASAPPVPIAAVLDVHLFRAEPLRSIAERSYFLDAISRAEINWRAAWRRRRALAEVIADFGTLTSKLATTGVVAAGAAPRYVPHTLTEAVTRASDVNAFDDEDEEA